MAQTPYIFNQLVSFLPKDYFDRLVKKYNGNAYVKNYSCWNHLLVMVWAQLTHYCPRKILTLQIPIKKGTLD